MYDRIEQLTFWADSHHRSTVCAVAEALDGRRTWESAERMAKWADETERKLALLLK